MNDGVPDPTPHVQALLDAMPWQAAVVDRNGLIRRTNRRWVDLNHSHGLIRDDVGTNYFAVCSGSSDSPEAGQAAQAIRAILEGERDRVDVQYPCHSPSTPHWFVMTVTPVWDGEVRVGALITHQEVTAQLESEHDLRAFVAHAAHDLRSPLRHLASFSELLEIDIGPSLEDQPRNWLSAIRRAALHMRSQLENLLALARSRIEPLSLTTIALGPLVTERMALQQEILHVSGIATAFGELHDVVTDEKLLTVLVDNVISNAIKHGRNAPALTLSVACDTAASEILIHFDDNGPGFGVRDVDQLLRPYVRLPRGATGLGLGLSIVKQVSLRLGGRVELGDSPLGGARVTVHLPRRDAGPEVDPPEPGTVELSRFG